MTLTTNTTKVSYNADGSTPNFNFAFALQDVDDLNVYINASLQMSGYSVVINSDGNSGTVTFGTNPGTVSVPVVVLLARNIDYLQQTDLPAESIFPEATLEKMIDRVNMGLQQLNEKSDRALFFPITSGINGSLGTPNPLDMIRVSADAMSVESVSIAQAFTDAVPAAGLGNVIGPVSSVVDNIATFNSANGQLIKDSGSSIANVLASAQGLVGTTNPNGNTAGFIGQRFADKTHIVDYVCTTAGSISTAVWTRLTDAAGTIKMWWSTAAVPAGYALCNGSNGTPNMIGMLAQGGDITGGSSSGNISGYTPITNQGTGGAITVSGNTGPASAQVNAGSGASLAATNTATHAFSASNQPAVVSIVFIMKIG